MNIAFFQKIRCWECWEIEDPSMSVRETLLGEFFFQDNEQLQEWKNWKLAKEKYEERISNVRGDLKSPLLDGDYPPRLSDP